MWRKQYEKLMEREGKMWVIDVRKCKELNLILVFYSTVPKYAIGF